MGQQDQKTKQNNYPRGDSSGKAFISLPSPRAISSGIIVFVSAFFLAFLTASSFTPTQNSSAETVTTAIASTGYYVTVAANNVSLDLIATPTGATAIGSDTVTVSTNCPGFKLYLSSSSSTSGSNNLYFEDDTDYYLASTTGSLTSGNGLKVLDTNSWGYTLLNTDYGNTTSITASSNFVGIPLLGSEDLIKSTTSANTSGVSTNVYFGAKANTAMPAGNYVGTITYTVLAEATDGTENISVSPGVVTTSDTLTIATPLYTDQSDLGTITITVGGTTCTNPTRTTSGNNLVSLTCTVPSLSINGDKTVTVTFSKYGKTYTLSSATYYYIPWDDLAYMQQMASYACDDATIATSTDASDYTSDSAYQKTLTDTRDGNTYRVRKLKDGNCWMSENLRLTLEDGYAVNVDDGSLIELTSANTDLTTMTSWTGGGTTETEDNHTTWESDTDNLSDLPHSYTFGTQKSTLDADQYLGIVYNWLVTTAGTGLASSAADTTTNDSICPSGWRVPIRKDATTSKSFTYLFSFAGSDADMADWYDTYTQPPYSFIAAGAYDPGVGAHRTNATGYYWTATVASTGSGPNNLGFDRILTNLDGAGTGRGRGFSIRCVAR